MVVGVGDRLVVCIILCFRGSPPIGSVGPVCAWETLFCFVSSFSTRFACCDRPSWALSCIVSLIISEFSALVVEMSLIPSIVTGSLFPLWLVFCLLEFDIVDACDAICFWVG